MTRRLLLILAVVGGASVIFITRSQRPKRVEPTESNRPSAVRATADGGAGLPVLAPGQRLTVELLNPPAASYEPPITLDDGDETFAALVRAIHTPAVYDPLLSRAAREVAVQSAVIGDTPPQHVLAFVLRSAGSVDTAAGVYRLSTTSDAASEVDTLLRSALADHASTGGTVRVGIGEAQTPDEKYTRRIVVLITERDVELDETPRTAPRGAQWDVKGRLPAGFDEAHATIMNPQGQLREQAVEIDGNRFALSIDTGDRAGPLVVSVDGVGPHGPTKLLQLVVHVGEPIPRQLVTHIPDPDPPALGIEEAEALAANLLAGDRASLGAPPLEIDTALSDIARRYSEEMRDRGTFGHLSTVSGLAGDRLVAGGYRAVSHAENLAKNTVVSEAERSLMESVSHRANIARAEFLRVGIGMAREPGAGAWYLTQLFAIPVEELDEDVAVGELMASIGASRGNKPPLAVDAHLVSIAQHGSELAAAGEVQGLPEALAGSVTDVHGKISVSVQAVFGLHQFQIPPPALERDARLIGLGVTQSESDPHGRTGVVVIVVQ